MYRVSYQIVFLFLLFLCVVAMVYADDAGQKEMPQPLPAAAAETAIVLQTDETLLPVTDTVPSRSAGRSSTAGMLFQLIVSLVAVCALIYGVLYFIRRSRRFTAADDPFLKNVASLALAPNKNIYIVTLIDKAYLIGASDSSLSLIAEITDKELIDAMNLHAAQTAGPKQDFGSLLQTFFPAAKPQTPTDPFGSFLSKQRERLQNTGTSQSGGAGQTSMNNTPSSTGNRYTEMDDGINGLGNDSGNGRRDT